MRTRLFGWGAFAWLLYVALFFVVPLPWLSMPVLMGLAVGLSLPPRAAGVASVLAWTAGCLMAPPQVILFKPHYNELQYAYILALTRPMTRPLAVGGGVVVFTLAELLSRLGTRIDFPRRAAAFLMLGFVLLGFLYQAQEVSRGLPELLRQEPTAKRYYFDAAQQLKALYLYRSGMGYYEAQRAAIEQDFRFQAPQPGLSLAPPLWFWLLGLLPDLGQLPACVWIFTTLLMVLAYRAALRRVDPIAALAVPSLLGSYFLYAETTNVWLTTTEMFGSLLLVAGVLAYLAAGWPYGLAVLTLAGLVRPFAAIPLALALMLAWRGRRRREVLASLGVAAFLGLSLALHGQNTRAALGIDALPLTERLHGSLRFALETLRFGAMFLAGKDVVMPVLAILGWAAALLWRGDRAVALLSGTSLLLFLLFCRLGSDAAQYYGFNYVPLLLVGAGLTVGRLATYQSSENSG